MSRAIAKTWGIVTVMLLVSGSLYAQDLKGRVTDEKDHPVFNADVRLYRDGHLKNRAYCNKKGKYHIWPIDPGGYQAVITVAGYDRIVRNINLKTRDSSVVDFKLVKKPGLLSLHL